MQKHNNENDQSKIKKMSKGENWIDDVMEMQEKDLEVEEEILSHVPNRIRHKWIDEEEK